MLNKFDYEEFQIIAKEEMMEKMYLFRLKGKMKFKPGQIVQVALDHFGEATYAPCSNPVNQDEFELCIRACGSTSNGLSNLLPGDKMLIRGPYGNGWPINECKHKDIILIAGGMGLVPLRSLIDEFIKNKKKFGKISLIAGFKSADHILFANDLEVWRKELHSVIAVAEYATKDFWGQKGLITEPLEEMKLNNKKIVVLICGPDGMITPVVDILTTKKIDPENIYISYERRMECGIGVCQHCNIGKLLVCKDGPVFSLKEINNEIGK